MTERLSLSLNSLVVSPTFFNLSLNFAIRSSWSEPQSGPGLVFVDCVQLLHLWLQKYNQSDLDIDHLVMSMCTVVTGVVGRRWLLWPLCPFGKTLVAFALLHFVLQGQICLLLQASLDFLVLHSRPLWWKGYIYICVCVCVCVCVCMCVCVCVCVCVFIYLFIFDVSFRRYCRSS